MSDYLWDKTGEPDAEVERLEQLLGTLAHKTRALELSDTARVEHASPLLSRRVTRPAVAVAAALALMLLAGAWLALSRPTSKTGPALARSTNVHNSPFMPNKTRNMQPSVHNDSEAVQRASHQTRARAELSSKKRRGAARAQGAREELALVVAAERQQAAKEQLVYALRLTGAKLSEVQTKVRGSSKEHEGSVYED